MAVPVEKDRLADRWTFAALLALLAVAPLPFGSDRPWAWSLAAAIVGLLLIAWGANAVFSRSQPAAIRPIVPAVALFVLVVGWAAVQTVPMVPGEWRHGLWAEAQAVLGIELAAPVSLDPHETWTAVMRLLSYGGIFLLTFQLCMSTDRSERLVRGLIVMTLAYAGYGLAVESAGLETVLWYAKADRGGNLSSTFLYRNAFATYAALGLLCALAMLFRPSMRRGDLDVGWRLATRALGDYFFARSWTMMLSCTILFAAILTTHSRAGLGVTVIGVAVFLAIMAWTRRRKRFVLLSIAVIGVATVAMFAVGGARTMDRMGLASSAAAERAEVYGRTIDAIALSPAAGVGYGTFANVFPMHRGEALRSPFLRAHNTYLENALELGVPATAALVAAIGWIVIICVSAVLRHRRRAFLPCLGIAATVMTGLHATVDYSLQIPAVAIIYAAILGAACAQSLRLELPRRRDAKRRTI